MLISSRFSRAGVRTVGYRGVFVYLHSFTPVNESACFSNESPCSSNKTQFPPTATLMTVITPPSQKNQRRNYNNLRTVEPLCACECVLTQWHRWYMIHDSRGEGEASRIRVFYRQRSYENFNGHQTQINLCLCADKNIQTLKKKRIGRLILLIFPVHTHYTIHYFIHS